jgi:MFS family permease
MGTAGGMIVLVLGILFNTKQVYMNYTPYVCIVCAVMAIGLVVFLLTVKEKKWADEMLIDSIAIEEKTEDKTETARKLTKSEIISLILILASVALWYIGYNSVTSKYSVYATRELGFDYNLTLIIAQAAAVVSYIPVGMISSKLGRKKTILIGITMLATAFFCGNFITPITPEFVMYPIFVLAGIGWATINVNSFPMVVELAKGGEIGKYTGYYYTASMAAQIVAPTLSGVLYRIFGMRNVFFVFATIFVVLSFVTMFFVKHGDAKAEKVDALEALGGADD